MRPSRFFPSRDQAKVVRDLAAAMVVLLVAAGGAYIAHALPADAADQDEDTADFRDSMKSDAQTIEGMIKDTQAGKNVSEFRLGMFSMNLLNELGDRDPGLGRYFHQGGRTMQTYLTDVFQYHDAEEVAHVAAMAQEPKADGARPMVRLSAKDALEALRHIPASKDAPETQAKDRADLAQALTTLKGDLAKAADD